MPVSEAISPSGISSFFEICNIASDGKSLTDPAVIGARGGGFAITRGAKARVQTRKAERSEIEIRINSKPAPEASTTRWALEHLLQRSENPLAIRADIKIQVPIGAGYGSSAAGTAAASLALADAAELPVTYLELGKITHMAEVINRTGLGTAAAVFVGGFDLVTEPGAPGIGQVDRLIFPKHHSILCAYLEPLPTREALSQSNLLSIVNPPARLAMQRIREKPHVETFLTESRKFGQKTGFETPEVTSLIDLMVGAGAVGAAQNMIGKAVHGVVADENALRASRLIKKRFPKAMVFMSQLDDRGVRIVRD